MYLRGKNQIREIEWGSNHLWDVRFVGNPRPPEPFADWFPATTVSENVYTMENHTLDGHMTSYSIPQRSAEFDMNFTYQDDQRLTLLSWFSHWVNNVILDGGLVVPLAEAAKQVELARLMPDRSFAPPFSYEGVEIPNPALYWVIPVGSQNYEGGSSAEPHQYQLDLVIVGKK